MAKVLLERGYEVSGSDLKMSRAARMLQVMGARVTLGHDGDLVEGCDVVVGSSAIADSNPELRRARELGISVMTRGEALAAVLSDSRSIVVAGTHGKTTTTSMIVTVLSHAGEDPTYLVGAGLNESGTNARSGDGSLAVAEADESDGSFLLLQPAVGVITNLEIDHVDRWSSIEELRAAFAKYMDGVLPQGVLVVPQNDEYLRTNASSTGRSVMTFGPGGDVQAVDVDFSAGTARFILTAGGRRVSVDLRVPGAHNVMNAAAAAAACLAVGLSLEDVGSGLERYRGVERRFERRGEFNGATIIDDYAHHPTEIAATLQAAQPGPWKRVVAVFQPHRYSRTRAMAPEFGRSFAQADRVVLMDVYGAGEEAVPGITGKLIADEVCRALPGRPVAYFPHRAELIRYLAKMVRPGDALLTLGAGDVTAIGDELMRWNGGVR